MKDMTESVFSVIVENDLINIAKKFTNGNSEYLELWLREYLKVDYRYNVDKQMMDILLSNLDYEKLAAYIKNYHH